MNNIPTRNEDISKVYSESKFDINKFNLLFDEERVIKQQQQKRIDEQKLEELNNQIINKKLYQYTLSEIFIGIKDSWFGLLDDLLEFDFTFNIFLKENRLFFFGITFLIIGVILYFYNFFVSDEQQLDQKEKVIEIHHIYSVPNTNIAKNVKQ